MAFDARVELHFMLMHFPIVLLLASFGLDGVGALTRREWPGLEAALKVQ